MGVVCRKVLIEQFCDFVTSSSYDEILGFKASAAVSNPSLIGNVRAEEGLVQLVSDYFDLQISSQIGLLSTHSTVVCSASQ